VNLLAEGWPCLVVGGGPVAHRKTLSLLAAGAKVRVVSPELCPELAELVAGGKTEHTPRRFESGDATGARIVFAATNDREANRAVLEAARAAGAWCCCVDENWEEGDFVTPAAFQREGLTIAVSTGGRSCRQAKMIKATLGRHIRSIASAELLVLGTSHEELSLEQREAIQPVGPRLDAVGGMLAQVWGIHEFLPLITCNRVEIAAIASDAVCEGDLIERILGFERLEERQKYRLVGYDAFEHMALVTAGMRSQSPGEYHVASQIKEALAGAVRREWAGGMMQSWVAAALHLSKHIKNEVTPLLHPAEIEDVSSDYVSERVGADWSGRMVLVIGSGMVGRSLIAAALNRNARCVWCYHVTRPEPAAAWSDRVRLISFNEMKESLGACDIVFCAAESPRHVLHQGHAPFFNQERRVVIVDLGVPRNVSPDLMPLLPEGELVNLDRLKNWAARTYGGLERALAMSRRIVGEHRNEYESLVERFQGRNAGQ
jgi:glutamyl-tRNA reductase